MKEPKRIPLGEETPNAKIVKKYRLPPLNSQNLIDDPLCWHDFSQIKKIHEDFYVQDTEENIKKFYEDNSKSN